MAGAPRKFDEELQAIYLEHYAMTGLHLKSAQAAGVSMQCVYDECDRNPEFKDKRQEAKQQYRESLAAEVHRRAVEGCNRPVFYKGRCVGEVNEKSDRLLELIVKKEIPEFRDHTKVDQTVTGEMTNNVKVKQVDLTKLNKEQREALRVLLGAGGEE